MKTFNAVVIILTAIVGICGIVLITEDNLNTDASVDNVVYSEFNNIKTLGIDILYPANDEITISFFEDHSIPYAVSEADLSESDMVVLTAGWVEKNQDTCIEKYVKMAEQGSILVVVDTEIDYEKTGLTMSYSKQADVNVLWMKPTQIRCNSPDLENTYKSLEFAFNWIEKKLENDKLYSEYDGELGTEIESVGTYSNSGYGNSAIQTYYYILPDASQTYDYIAAHYYVQMIPNGGSFNSGLDVKSECNNVYALMSYGPATTIGTTSTSANIALNAGLDVSVTAGLSWAYSIADVVVYNYSDITTKKLDIRHNVDETKPVGTTTFFAEPGKIVKLTAGNTYTSTDTYKSQFCHKILGLYVQYNDVSYALSVTINT